MKNIEFNLSKQSVLKPIPQFAQEIDEEAQLGYIDYVLPAREQDALYPLVFYSIGKVFQEVFPTLLAGDQFPHKFAFPCNEHLCIGLLCSLLEWLQRLLFEEFR